MSCRLKCLAIIALAASVQVVAAGGGALGFPKTVEAGQSFSVPTTGRGEAVLYVVGPAQVVSRRLKLGETVKFPSGDLHNAGHYLAVLAGPTSSEPAEFDVVPKDTVESLSFLAKPSRV